MSTRRSSAALNGPPVGPGRIVGPVVGAGEGPPGEQAAMDNSSAIAMGRIRSRAAVMSCTAR